MENEFPPNDRGQARRPKSEPVEKKEVRQVTRGRVIQRKKSLRKKFFEAFRPDDNVGFMEHILIDTLVPSIKSSVADAATDAIEDVLGVGGARRRRRREGGGGYTSYNRMSSARPRDRRDREDDRRPSRREESRIGDDAREIVLETRVEGEEVIDGLFELISKYDSATMRDLLSMVGEPSTPVHEDWGWHDVRGARVHKVRDGYLLDLPRPEPLD